MEMKLIFVETKCKDVGARYYCIYCNGEVIPERDYKYQHEDNLRYLCCCQGAQQAALTQQNSQEE